MTALPYPRRSPDDRDYIMRSDTARLVDSEKADGHVRGSSLSLTASTAPSASPSKVNPAALW